MRTRSLFFLAFLAFPTSGWGVSLKRPSKEDLEPLKAKLEKIKARSWEASQYSKEIISIEIEIGLRNKDGVRHRPPEPPSGPLTAAAKSAYLRELNRYSRIQEEALGRFAGIKDARKDAYALAARRVKRAQDDAHKLRQEAITLALVAYGISPNPKSGPILSGSPRGNPSEFIVSHLGETASWNPNSRSTLRKGLYAETQPDGSVSVGPDAFEYAGKLGLTLYHEAMHFERKLKPDQDLRNEPAEEVRAREAAKRHLRSIFQLEQKDIDDHERVFQAEMARASVWEEQIKRGLNPYKLTDRPAFRGAGHGSWLESDPDVSRELERIEKGQEDLRRAAKKASADFHLAKLRVLAESACDYGPVAQTRLDLVERHSDAAVYCADPPAAGASCHQRAFRDMLDQLCRSERIDAAGLNERIRTIYGGRTGPPVEEAGPAPPQQGPVEATPPPNAAWELADFASKACSNPGSIGPEDVRRLRWFPDSRIAFTDDVESGLGGCSRDLFSRLVGFSKTWEPGSRLNPDWVNEFARRWASERRPAPPLEEPSGGNDKPERDKGGKKDPCYNEPGVGRVCPVR